jgi:hypothetical protein
MMRRVLGSSAVKIFATCWILYSLHFATNVVREHYPAFSLAERGDFKLDPYQGFHPDIFVHTDGHSYVNNNIGASLVGAVPLFIFDPLLDIIERNTRRSGEEGLFAADRYRTKYRNNRELFRKVSERGLHLRFGAATFITSVLLMAPLTALIVVLMFRVLRLQGVAESRAVWLAMLFAFGTPMFYRASLFNHNMMVMYLVFGAFYLLWIGTWPAPAWRCAIAGMLCGYAIFVDYGSIVLYFVMLAYVMVKLPGGRGTRSRAGAALQFVVGSAPTLGALFFTQWAMFGHPFLPAQYWMPVANYTDRGWRGFAWPDWDGVVRNLFDPSYGMFTFGPLLLLALLPPRPGQDRSDVLPKAEWRLALIMAMLFLLFCSANQYSRMQFNTGFRYLVPLVPMLYLAACNHLARLSGGWLIAMTVPCVLHSWVLSMVREPVPESWGRFLAEGIQLPWLAVLRQTLPQNYWVASSGLLPAAALSIGAALIGLLWYAGRPGQERSRHAA